MHQYVGWLELLGNELDGLIEMLNWPYYDYHTDILGIHIL